MSRVVYLFMFLVLVLPVFSGCDATSEDTLSVTSEAEPIVRAVQDGGPDQVMLLISRASSTQWRFCSGTLVGPRVLLTAAHCIASDTMYVYWGDDYFTDIEALPGYSGYLVVPPPEDSTSVWAEADSIVTHPDYNPSVNGHEYPDLALVYLDRKPPMSPLPLSHYALGAWTDGQQATIAGWGASEALSADISQTTGGRIQRTGRTVLLGSPTATDYHEDDPNAAMLNPAIRAKYIKTNGSAPFSNGCAGDSGGPLLLNNSGSYIVAGVASWTGLWCEDYSLYTRTYPFEQSFINPNLLLGGSRPVQGVAKCIDERSDGSLRAYLGYDNKNLVSQDIPLNWRNQLTFDTANRRTTHFEPGVKSISTYVDVPPNQTAVWQLIPENGWGTSLVVNKWIVPQCGETPDTDTSCAQSCAARDAVGCEDAMPFDFCMDDCLSLADIADGTCETEYNTLLACEGEGDPEDFFCYPGWGAIALSCGEPENIWLDCVYAWYGGI